MGSRGLTYLALFMLCSSPAAGARAADCEGWLPDLTCEREARFAGFTAPVTAPYLAEEPFITTGISSWGLWHRFPESSALMGGDAVVWALQVRLALTERLGLIATKDGRMQLRPDNPLLDTEKGYGDLGLGLKYALIHDVENAFMLSPSLRYEATNGTRDTLQGNGEGVWIPAISIAKALQQNHVLLSVGARIPVDGDKESTVGFYNLHIDREVSPGLGVFVELNGYHYLDEGDGSNTVRTSLGVLPISVVQSALGFSGFEALDVANLGSDDVEGNDVLTWAVGFRRRLGENLSLGLGYERPLTTRRDILKDRWTLNLLWEL